MPKLAPVFAPETTPAKDKTKVEAKAIVAGNHIGFAIIESATPAAKASRLVAKAYRRRTDSLDRSDFSGQVPTFRESLIIPRPTYRSKPKAIQWSNSRIADWKLDPACHPITGIANWNAAKEKATLKVP